MNLRFNHENDGVVTQTRVWSDQFKHVRITCNGIAQICFSTVFPIFQNVVAWQAFQIEFIHISARIYDKPSAQNNGIALTFYAIFINDRVLSNFADAIGNQANIFTVKSFIPLVRNQDTLTTNGVIRREFRTYFRIFNLMVNKALRKELHGFCNGWIKNRPDTHFIRKVQT